MSFSKNLAKIGKRGKRIFSILKSLSKNEKSLIVKDKSPLLEEVQKNYNSLKVEKNFEDLLRKPIARISESSLKKVENLVFVFSGSGLRGLAYIPIVEKLRNLRAIPSISIGSSGGCLAALGLMSGIKKELFLSNMEFDKWFSKINTPIKLFKNILLNKGKSLLLNGEIRKAIKNMCNELNLYNPSNLNGFFGISSIYKGNSVVIFGKYNDLELSSSLPLWDLVYSSIAAPVSLEPIKIENSSLSVYYPYNNEIKSYHFKEVYLYDGAASSPLPLNEAITISKNFFDLNTTLFVIFNLVNEVNKNIKFKEPNAYRIFNDFIHGSLVSIMRNDLERAKNIANIVMFNINYDGELNEIWFSDVNKIGEAIKKGETFSINHLEKFFKGN